MLDAEDRAVPTGKRARLTGSAVIVPCSWGCRCPSATLLFPFGHDGPSAHDRRSPACWTWAERCPPVPQVTFSVFRADPERNSRIAFSAGVGSLLMMSRQRDAELVLTGIVGGTPVQRVAIPLAEAFMITVTAMNRVIKAELRDSWLSWLGVSLGFVMTGFVLTLSALVMQSALAASGTVVPAAETSVYAVNGGTNLVLATVVGLSVVSS